MRRIDCGVSGTTDLAPALSWQQLALGPPWKDVIKVLNPHTFSRPIQAKALGERSILHSRRNLVLSAPTNSGKSLIGLLALLEAVNRGHRAILLEPLRALAREKMSELESVANRLGNILGRSFKVRISTGDYRIDDETFADPPPQQGELLVATPERLEAILRNADYASWIESIDAVCVDEAHLLGSPHRGPTLEYLLTSFLCLSTPPRLILLSATLGNVEHLRTWLAPCDTIQITERYPSLQKEVIELDAEENADDMMLTYSRSIFDQEDANLLVFVYQTRSAERL